MCICSTAITIWQFNSLLWENGPVKIVDLPIYPSNMVMFHSYVAVYQKVLSTEKTKELGLFFQLPDGLREIA